MIYLFILIYLILVPGTMLIMLYQIINKLEEIKKEPKQTTTKSVLSKRKHTNIKASNYDNVFSSRSKTNKAYEDYTTNKGLYEPVTPHKGVKIKKEV